MSISKDLPKRTPITQEIMSKIEKWDFAMFKIFSRADEISEETAYTNREYFC